MAKGDGVAAEEIAKQIAALQPQVQGKRGVMGYLDKPDGDPRKDVNKFFLANTIRSVDTHNRRHDEDKCWKLRELEQKLEPLRRRRHRSRSSSSHRSERWRSVAPKRRRRHSRSRSRSGSRRHKSSRRVGPRQDNTNVTDEREYWAKKKAEKARKLRENQFAASASVDNAPGFSSSESDADDVKPPRSNSKTHKEHTHKEKKSKKSKKSMKSKKSKKSEKRSRSRS